MLFRVCALAIALWGALVSQAFAFTVLPSAGSDGARWREQPVRFNVNYEFSPYSPDRLDAILMSAFEVWNSVATSTLRLEIGDATTANSEDFLSARTNETAIVFDPNFATTIGADSTVLAVGTAINVGDRYTQGFIVINAFARGVGTDTERLRVILAHEIGHAVGLGHTSDEAALMYPYAQRISQLGQDDVSGISYLYPRKEGLDGAPFGCGTIKNATPPASGLAAFAGWFTLFSLCWAALRFKGVRA